MAALGGCEVSGKGEQGLQGPCAPPSPGPGGSPQISSLGLLRCTARQSPAHPERCTSRMSSREGYSRSQNSMKFNFPPI